MVAINQSNHECFCLFKASNHVVPSYIKLLKLCYNRKFSTREAYKINEQYFVCAVLYLKTTNQSVLCLVCDVSSKSRWYPKLEQFVLTNLYISFSCWKLNMSSLTRCQKFMWWGEVPKFHSLVIGAWHNVVVIEL